MCYVRASVGRATHRRATAGMYHSLLHDLCVARPFRDGVHLHDVPLHLHDEVGELLLAVCIRCIWEAVREGGAGADRYGKGA